MRFLRRPFDLFLAVFYVIGNVVLGSAAESNIWTERKKALAESRTQALVQMARLPAVLPPLSTPLSSLPATAGFAKNLVRPLPSALQELIVAVPAGSAVIQDIYDSKKKTAAPVVLIQDVHLNSEAQSNIATTLQALIDQRKIGFVGVEGAFEPFDFAPFRSFPNQQILAQVADEFFSANLIAAPSYVGIRSAVQPPAFIGVDDCAHYDANVTAYLSARAIKEKVTGDLARQKRGLSDEKKKIYTDELLEFDALKEGYHAGTLGMGTYLQKLSSRQIVSQDPVVKQFLEAARLESTLNFTQVERERQSVLAKLTNKLSSVEMGNLMQQSLAYKFGRLRFGAYYQSFRDLCERKGVALRQTPAFADYIRYVLLADGIKADELFDAVEKLETAITAELTKTDEQKSLAQRSELLLLSKKLVEFSLTPKEWEKYGKIKTENRESRIDQGNINFEAFYREADIRSRKIVENLLKGPAARRQSSVAALVVGGFHTPLITQLLKERGISYIVASPKITKIEDAAGSSYLSAFAREKTPLDQLFQGEKLFLALKDRQITDPNAFVRILALAGYLLSKINPVRVLFKAVPIDVTVKEGATLAESTFRYSLPMKYTWVTIVVPALELAFALVIPLSQSLAPSNPWIGFAVWILSAALFAALHPDLTWRRLLTLFTLGLLFGAPFVATDFSWSIALRSFGRHGLYNGLVLTARLLVNPQSRFGKFVGAWAPLATIDSLPVIARDTSKGTMVDGKLLFSRLPDDQKLQLATTISEIDRQALPLYDQPDEWFARLNNSSEQVMLLIDDQSKVAAFLMYTTDVQKQTAHLANMAVSKARRHNGYGRFALDTFLGWLSQEGIKKVNWTAVNSHVARIYTAYLTNRHIAHRIVGGKKFDVQLPERKREGGILASLRDSWARQKFLDGTWRGLALYVLYTALWAPLRELAYVIPYGRLLLQNFSTHAPPDLDASIETIHPYMFLSLFGLLIFSINFYSGLMLPALIGALFFAVPLGFIFGFDHRDRAFDKKIILSGLGAVFSFAVLGPLLYVGFADFSTLQSPSDVLRLLGWGFIWSFGLHAGYNVIRVVVLPTLSAFMQWIVLMIWRMQARFLLPPETTAHDDLLPLYVNEEEALTGYYDHIRFNTAVTAVPEHEREIAALFMGIIPEVGIPYSIVNLELRDIQERLGNVTDNVIAFQYPGLKGITLLNVRAAVNVIKNNRSYFPRRARKNPEAWVRSVLPRLRPTKNLSDSAYGLLSGFYRSSVDKNKEFLAGNTTLEFNSGEHLVGYRGFDRETDRWEERKIALYNRVIASKPAIIAPFVKAQLAIDWLRAHLPVAAISEAPPSNFLAAVKSTRVNLRSIVNSVRIFISATVAWINKWREAPRYFNAADAYDGYDDYSRLTEPLTPNPDHDSLVAAVFMGILPEVRLALPRGVDLKIIQERLAAVTDNVIAFHYPGIDQVTLVNVKACRNVIKNNRPFFRDALADPEDWVRHVLPAAKLGKTLDTTRYGLLSGYAPSSVKKYVSGVRVLPRRVGHFGAYIGFDAETERWEQEKFDLYNRTVGPGLSGRKQPNPTVHDAVLDDVFASLDDHTVLYIHSQLKHLSSIYRRNDTYNPFNREGSIKANIKRIWARVWDAQLQYRPQVAVDYGKTRLGPYVLEGKIGEGNFGTVFRVRDTRRPADDSTRFALKIPKHSGNVTENHPFVHDYVFAFALLRQETIRLANVPEEIADLAPHYVDSRPDRSAGLPYLVMEEVDGVTLNDLWHDDTTGQYEAAFFAVLKAVQRVHRAGLVINDIKPENFLVKVRPDGSVAVKIIDWATITPVNAFRLGSRVGTPRYADVQRVLHERIHFYASDVFSLARVLLHQPLSDERLTEERMNQVNDWMRRALADRQEDRPALEELIKALAPIIAPSMRSFTVNKPIVPADARPLLFPDARAPAVWTFLESFAVTLIGVLVFVVFLLLRDVPFVLPMIAGIDPAPHRLSSGQFFVGLLMSNAIASLGWLFAHFVVDEMRGKQKEWRRDWTGLVLAIGALLVAGSLGIVQGLSWLPTVPLDQAVSWGALLFGAFHAAGHFAIVHWKQHAREIIDANAPSVKTAPKTPPVVEQIGAQMTERDRTPLGKLYLLVGVQWEIIFPWMIPVSAGIADIFGGLPEIKYVFWIISSLLFIAAHPQAIVPRPTPRWYVALALVGFGMGIPFLIPGWSFSKASDISILIHLAYNGAVMVGRSNRMGASINRFFRSLPYASVVESATNINRDVVRAASEQYPAMEMEEGAEWLADVGAAIVNKKPGDLFQAEAIGIAKQKTQVLSHERVLLGQLSLWVENAAFLSLLKTKLETRLDPNHSNVSAQELTDVLLALVLAKGVQQQNSARYADIGQRVVMYFKFDPHDQDARINRVRVMQALLKTEVKKAEIYADPSAARAAEQARRLLVKAGFLEEANPNVQQLLENDINLETLNEWASAEMLVVPKTVHARWGNLLANKRVVALELLMPPLDQPTLNFILTHLEQVMVGA